MCWNNGRNGPEGRCLEERGANGKRDGRRGAAEELPIPILRGLCEAAGTARRGEIWRERAGMEGRNGEERALRR